MRIRTILHPTDFSRSARAALAHALRLARRYGATLHVLHATPSLGDDPVRSAYDFGTGDERALQEMAEEAQQRLKALIDETGLEGVDVVHAYDRGIAPAPVILDYAAAHDVDLIAMGTHGRRGVKRFMLGSVAEEVVRRAACSVLTVRDEQEGDTTPPPIERVLVPVDLSTFTAPLFRAAKDVAAAFEARIDLLHVVEPLPFPIPLVGGVTLHDLVPDPAARANEQMAHLIETVGGPHVTVKAHVREGHAASVIVEEAEALGTDLIVTASHGLSGIEGFLLGSVTARVVRRAGCPVLVARVAPETEAEAARWRSEARSARSSE